MALRNLLQNDRFLFIGLTATSIGFLVGLRHWLTYLRNESEIKPTESKSKYITQETEDSLKLSTLESLLGHYNFAIRETSAKIICDRAVNDPDTIRELLWGITRPDYEERMRSLRALALITDASKLNNCIPAIACGAR